MVTTTLSDSILIDYRHLQQGTLYEEREKYARERLNKWIRNHGLLKSTDLEIVIFDYYCWLHGFLSEKEKEDARKRLYPFFN